MVEQTTAGFVTALSRRIGETGAMQVRQLHRLTDFFGLAWMGERETEAGSSSLPSVLTCQDGTARTMGARFFRCCRRRSWQAYQRGTLTRAGVDWLFDHGALDLPSELRGDGIRRRSKRAASPQPPTPRAPKVKKAPPPPRQPIMFRAFTPPPAPEVYAVRRRPRTIDS